MSEAAEQTRELEALMRALIQSQAALASAEGAAKSYGQALANGTAKLDAAKAAEIEAARIIAQANEQKAKARFQAEADGSAAAKREADVAMQTAKAIEAAEKKKRDAAAETAAKGAKVKELAIGAAGGEETVEKYNKMREAAKLAGDSSLTMGQRVTAGASAMRFAAGTAMALGGSVASAAGDVVKFVQEARQAEAALAAYDQRVHALGGSLGAMRAATAGAIDTQVAFNLSLSMADQGLRASESQQAVLARAIREHANARQVSQEQASAVVQRAFAGDAQAATSLGLSLSSTTTTAERYTVALRQLEQQQRGNATATETAAEAAKRNEQEMARAAQTAQAAAGSWVRALPLVRLYAAGLDAYARHQEEANAATDAGGQALARHTMEQERSARAAERLQALERARIEDSRQAMALQQSAAVQELQYLDEWVVGLGEVVSAESQVNQARQAAREFAVREGETETQANERRIQAANNLAAALRRKNAEESRSDSVRRAEAELGMLARQLRAHGMAVNARIASVAPAERLLQLQREIATFARREGETVEQAAARAQQIGQEINALRQRGIEAANRAADTAAARAEDAKEQAVALALEVKAADVRRRAGEQALEYLQRRIAAQRELNESEQARLIANEQAIAQGREAESRISAATAARIAQENEASNTEIQRRTQALAQLNATREQWATDASNTGALRALEDSTRRALVGGDAGVIEREMRARAEAIERFIASGEDRTDAGAARIERLQREAEAVRGIGSAWRDANDATLAAREAFGLAAQQAMTTTQAMMDGAKAGVSGLGELARGSVDALVQAQSEGRDVGAAVAATVDQWATAKAVQWGMQSAEAFAGAGLAYFIRPDAMPGLLASGATYAGLALAAGGIAAAIPNAPAVSPASSAPSSSGLGFAASSPMAARDSERDRVNVVFNISGVMANDQTEEVIAQCIRNANMRGYFDYRR